MSERFESFENAAERVPNEREVFNQFELLLNGREFTEVNRVEDESGLDIWDIVTVDETGDQVDISYQRAKTLKNGVKTNSRITQTLYFNGIPCGAGPRYDFVNGEWEERS